MFILSLLYFLKGYVTIRVYGRKAERLINIAIERKIHLWNIRRGNKYIRLNLTINGYKELWYVCRKLNIQIRLTKKRGFPFLLHKLLRRKIFAFGLVLIILTLYLLSSFIWFVEIKGIETIDNQEFTQYLKDNNLSPGVFKIKIDSADLEQKLIVKYPEIAWVSINITGTQVLVEVVEKDPADVSEKGPSNLIASKDGVINKILVLSGERQVEQGQTVTKGQVLVTGQMFNEESRTHMQVRSFGIVEALVWYDGYGEAKNEETVYTATENTHKVTYISALGRKIKVPGKQVPFEKYNQIEEIDVLKIGKSKLPIQVITVTYNEVVSKKVKYNPNQMETLARERAIEAAEAKLPKDISVEDKTITVIEKDANIVRVKVILETIEDIGQIQRIN